MKSKEDQNLIITLDENVSFEDKLYYMKKGYKIIMSSNPSEKSKLNHSTYDAVTIEDSKGKEKEGSSSSNSEYIVDTPSSDSSIEAFVSSTVAVDSSECLDDNNDPLVRANMNAARLGNTFGEFASEISATVEAIRLQNQENDKKLQLVLDENKRLRLELENKNKSLIPISFPVDTTTRFLAGATVIGVCGALGYKVVSSFSGPPKYTLSFLGHTIFELTKPK